MDVTAPLTTADLAQLHCRPLEGEAALAQPDIERQLGELQHWRYDAQAGAIVRDYAFGDYYETLAFVNALAYVVHREDHHPELVVGYNRCRVAFNTHSVSGISLNDFICAAKCDALYAAAGASAS